MFGRKKAPNQTTPLLRCSRNSANVEKDKIFEDIFDLAEAAGKVGACCISMCGNED